MNGKKFWAVWVGLAALCLAGAAGWAREGQSSTTWLFFVDLRQNDLPGVAMSKTAARYFLDSQVGAEDAVAVLTYSDIRGFKVREEPTTDHGRVRKSLARLTEIFGAADTEVGWIMRLSNHNFLEDMNEFAKNLAEIPGTKNVVYFTNGLPVGWYEGDWKFRDLYDGIGQHFKDSQAPVFIINSLGHRADWQSLPEKTNWLLKKLADASGGRYFGDIAEYKTIALELAK